MNIATDWIVVGRFGRPHGLKGFITVHSFTNPRENLLQYDHWHAKIKNQWLPLKIMHVELNHKSILVQVDGYLEREQIASLTNVDIGIQQAQLAELPPEEIYWHELIGMHVITQEGTALGSVTEILPTGSNDVMVVQGDKRLLIPYLPGIHVIKIDKVQRQIIVDWDPDF